MESRLEALARMYETKRNQQARKDADSDKSKDKGKD
jgi:hypothetical protein